MSGKEEHNEEGECLINLSSMLQFSGLATSTCKQRAGMGALDHRLPSKPHSYFCLLLVIHLSKVYALLDRNTIVLHGNTEGIKWSLLLLTSGGHLGYSTTFGKQTNKKAFFTIQMHYCILISLGNFKYDKFSGFLWASYITSKTFKRLKSVCVKVSKSKYLSNWMCKLY